MIHPKPFDFSEMLSKTIFLGRPNFFNAKDLNKELMIIHSFMEEFNKKFAVISEIDITFNTFGEVVNTTGSTPMIDRTFNFSWDAKPILYHGVQFQITAGGTGYTHKFPVPNTGVSPREVSPPTYIVLKATLETVTFATDPVLCGLTSDETPNSVPSVNVEQYKNVEITVSENLAEDNIICVVGTIHPRYKDNGDPDGFGFIKNTFSNEYISISNGVDRKDSELKTNKTLFEYITEKVTTSYNNIINERQLIRKFHLADIGDFDKARNNIGFSNVVNRRQLVQAENLKDLPSPEYARKHLGLGSASTRNVGSGVNDVAPGTILAIGVILMWFGAPSQIPNGWVECDGTNNTPNLRGKFPVGYDPNDADHAMGAFGGEKAVKLTANQSGLRGHTHALTDPGHNHGINQKGTEKVSGSGNQNSMSKNDGGGASININSATTGISIASATAVDASETHENRPPFMTLMFIMYKGVDGGTILPPVLPDQPDLTYPNYSSSTPGVTGTDGGYSTYDYESIANATHINLGAGVILTNPE